MKWPWSMKKEEEVVREKTGPDWLYHPTPLEELRQQAEANIRAEQPLSEEQAWRLNIDKVYLGLIWEKILKIEKMLEKSKGEAV